MRLFRCLLLVFCYTLMCNCDQEKFDLVSIEKDRVLNLAFKYKSIKPLAVTDSVCERSAGSSHDFYSEGDYWWPDPENPNGPYIRKDGLTNPKNFTAHRKAMIQLSQISGALASAYIITGKEEYVKQLVPHLQTWFINNDTKMNPNLLYGQAIKGKVTGRGIGIIDTIHLMEVALAIKVIQYSKSISQQDIKALKSWFKNYLKWITSHPFGIAERDNGNNHSVCWAMQVAVFANLVDNQQQLKYCRAFYKNTLLPDQMNENGSFPKELSRTKPYGYSLFNLDAMVTLCQILSTPDDNLFLYTAGGNKNILTGMSFLYPYIKDKNIWPYTKDVMYWDEWPSKHSSLLFVGLSSSNQAYLKLWQSLPKEINNPEVLRNMPVRFPVLWTEN